MIGGFTDRNEAGRATEVGSLLLGVYDDAGRLIFAGSVGTGWDSRGAMALRKRLAALEVPAPPFANAVKNGRWTRRPAGSEHWVKPVLVAEVTFAEWTPEGQVRHASFVALRSDKAPTEIRREG